MRLGVAIDTSAKQSKGQPATIGRKNLVATSFSTLAIIFSLSYSLLSYFLYSYVTGVEKKEKNNDFVGFFTPIFE